MLVHRGMDGRLSLVTNVELNFKVHGVAPGEQMAENMARALQLSTPYTYGE
jgi:hypothetical protein